MRCSTTPRRGRRNIRERMEGSQGLTANLAAIAKSRRLAQLGQQPQVSGVTSAVWSVPNPDQVLTLSSYRQHGTAARRRRLQLYAFRLTTERCWWWWWGFLPGSRAANVLMPCLPVLSLRSCVARQFQLHYSGLVWESRRKKKN